MRSRIIHSHDATDRLRLGCHRVGMAVLVSVVAACGGEPESPPPLSGDLTRFDLVVENATPRSLSRAELWVDAPRPASADWRRVGIEVSHPYSLEPRGFGDERIRVAFEDVPVGFSDRVSVRASLEPDGSSASGLPPDLAPFVEVVSGFDARALSERAQALTGAEEEATADNLVAWAEANGGSPEALALRQSSRARADEPADDAALAEGGPRGPGGELLGEAVSEPSEGGEVWLAVALLRAAGLPARVVAGFADRGDGALRADGFELWLEVHRDGRWQTRRLATPAGEAERMERVVGMRIVAQPDDLSAGPVAQSLAESAQLRVSFQ